jgi:ribosomal protein S18 acetylase RimI-like enzyme
MIDISNSRSVGSVAGQISKAKTLDDVLPLEVESTLEQGYIFNLCVVKRARQQGVAKALMQAALQVLRRSKCFDSCSGNSLVISVGSLNNL